MWPSFIIQYNGVLPPLIYSATNVQYCNLIWPLLMSHKHFDCSMIRYKCCYGNWGNTATYMDPGSGSFRGIRIILLDADHFAGSE